jgi:hypothetical protein
MKGGINHGASEFAGKPHSIAPGNTQGDPGGLLLCLDVHRRNGDHGLRSSEAIGSNQVIGRRSPLVGSAFHQGGSVSGHGEWSPDTEARYGEHALACAS